MRLFQPDYEELYHVQENLGSKVTQAGALEAEIREPVKLGVKAGFKSESAVRSYTHRTLEAGGAVEQTQQICYCALLGSVFNPNDFIGLGEDWK